MKKLMNALQIDLARQKESVEFVKSYLDFAKDCGYNTMIFYLENVVRTPDTEYFSHDDTYSMEEMKEMVDYGTSLGIEIIPEYENLAHLEKFFQYKEWQHLSEIDENNRGRGLSGQPRGQDGCISNPDLIKWTNKYIEDVNVLFNTEYLMVCMDEPFDLAVCDRCKERLAKGETKYDMFLKHVLETYELSKKLGKKLIIADDFFQYANIAEELPRDIIFANWNYGYFDDEQDGLWVDRIKNDWLAYYDRLGFSYVCYVKAFVGSPTYNIDAFYDYIKNKKNLIGFVNTVWCRSDNFYQQDYPLIEYTAKVVNGEVSTRENLSMSETDDRIQLYSKMLKCSEHCAECILALESFGSLANPYGNYTYADVLSYRAARKSSRVLINEIKKELREPTDLSSQILMDIYYTKLDSYNYARLTKINNLLFSCYQTGEDQTEFIPALLEIRKDYEDRNEFLKMMWEKYRKGIKSANGDFERRLEAPFKKIDELIEKLKKNETKGILYYDYMMIEAWQTSKTRLIVKYVGEDKEEVLFDGGLKCLNVNEGGITVLKVATENKPIEYVRCALYGEGHICPIRFRHYAQGVKYTADTVEYISGHVENMEKVLTNGCEHATLGIANGAAHFNDFELSKQVHEIKVGFRVL